MRLAAGLFVLGLAFAAFGISYIGTNVCRAGSCGMSPNQMALLVSVALMVLAIIVIALRPRAR